jgi:hypothetical protein
MAVFLMKLAIHYFAVFTERSWVQTPTEETIFQAPFIRIKAWSKNQVEITLALLHML